jgi:hypothetical protein
MITRDEVYRAVSSVENGHRGFDDHRLWFGRPSTWQGAGDRPERVAVSLLLAVDQYAGAAATWAWDFHRQVSRVEFWQLVEELEAGVSALRNLYDDLDDLPS